MPSNYTQNYDLNQWSKDDQVKMEDFNLDNAKIDAAISTKCEIVTGTYTGDGAAQRNIYLSRSPKAVFVSPESGDGNGGNGRVGGCATPELPVVYLGLKALSINDTGFTVYQGRSNSSYVELNQNGNKYRYVAFL